MEHDPRTRTIYRKLCTVIPNLQEHLKAGTEHGKSKLYTDGLMDLSYDFLSEDGEGIYLIALAHHYEQNGDLVPDPDMEIKVNTRDEVAEAMSFQNAMLYQHVGHGEERKERLQKDLNEFLEQWLDNALAQGHRIDLSKVKTREDDIDSARGEKGRDRETGMER